MGAGVVITSAETAKRPRGRPRNPAIDEAVLTATRELVVQVGYGALALDQVAERAGVSRTSLYLRWPSKGVLVWEAVLGGSVNRPMPDSGRFDQDLRALVGWAVEQFSDSAAKVALPSMLAEFGLNAELHETLSRNLIGPEVARAAALLERGKARGEIRSDVDIDLVVSTFVGAILARAVFDQSLDGPFADDLTNLLLRAVGFKRRR